MGVRLAKAMSPKPSTIGFAPPDRRRQPDTQRGDQRHRDRAGGDAAGIVGDADDLRGRERGHRGHQHVAPDDQPVQGPALEDAQHPEQDRRAYRERHHHAQLEGVGVAGALVGGDGPGFRGDLGRLRGNGDQGRLGDGGAETEAEGKRQQGRGAPLAREGLRDGLAEGKQPAFEPLDEERQAGDHAHQADGDAPEIRKGLLQHRDLEEGDDDDDGRQISQGFEEPPQYRAKGPGHGCSLESFRGPCNPGSAPGGGDGLSFPAPPYGYSANRFRGSRLGPYQENGGCGLSGGCRT